jgi:hypothetical protein
MCGTVLPILDLIEIGVAGHALQKEEAPDQPLGVVHLIHRLFHNGSVEFVVAAVGHFSECTMY